MNKRDGPAGKTCELVERWSEEDKRKSRYIRQDNLGMHGAHNAGYQHIEKEMNNCIDSDDYMPDDAVEKILKCWREKGSDRVAGIIGLDADFSGNLIGTAFPEGLNETTLGGFYAGGGRGDKKMVYRTDVIRNYPEYPLFAGEKYVPLGYKYHLMDPDYTLLPEHECVV